MIPVLGPAAAMRTKLSPSKKYLYDSLAVQLLPGCESFGRL